jgi:hypothetical protein
MTFSFFKKRPDTFDYEAERVCKNCGFEFQGKFCNRCGEKVVDVSDRSLARLAESILNAFTFLEGKFWRSFKTMILHPGKLSERIRSGVQVPYMRLVGLFFVANFFYFLFPVFDSFNSSLSSQFYQQDYSELVQKLVREHIKDNQLDVETYTRAYNARTGNLSKLLIVVLVFFYTLPLSIINYSKKNLFFDHLQISFEFHAFTLLLNSVLVPLFLKALIGLAAAIFGWNWTILLSDHVYSSISQVFFAYFFICAQYVYYGNRWWVAIIKGGILAFLVFYTWKLYRLFLFLATFYTL